jgi:MFS family permease
MTGVPRPAQDWRALLAVFWLTSMVEGIGVSQIFALLPTYLSQMGVAEADRLAFVGLFGSLIFIVGAPLVPLWGVWADKYSRKAVIIRSAIVEAVVFAAVALSREPWQLAASMLLIGLQLGNTGVMLAGIRDVAPKARLGTAIALFGASGAVGFAVGPALAGILVDGFGWSLPAVFATSAVLSVATAILVAVGSREIRPEVVPQGRVIDLAFGAVRGVLADPTVRRIFAIFGVAFLANQMARPYLPLLVEGVVRPGEALTSSIALVAGTAALVGALVSPLGGALGDRIGFRPVLVAALLGGGVALAVMPSAPNVGTLALVALAFAACTAAVSAMVFGLLATEVPPERRSATLNLVYLPLYAAGIVGPATGSVVASFGGLAGPFLAGAIVLVLGGLVVALRGARGVRPAQAPAVVGSATPRPRRDGDASAADPAGD